MRQTERQTDIPINLETAIRRIAQERGLHVGCNTHYDAMNCVVSWINDKTLYRLDFQLTTSDSTNVTLHRDHYRFLIKLLSWADSSIPYFSYMTPLFRKIEFQKLRELSNGESVEYYIKDVREYIDHST